MLNYDEFIKEAVKISDYRPYHKLQAPRMKEIYKEYFMTFPDHDKNYFRIYFDLKIDPSKWNLKIPQEIQDYMGWYGYPIIDYAKGLCRDGSGREIRIGRLFHKLNRPDLLKSYEDSKLNTLKEGDYQVVISRHTYDMVGKSTNRGWSTCLDLNDDRYGGKHKHHLKEQMNNLIAYLIRKNDRNINHPLSRVDISGGNYVDSHVYGAYCKEFQDFVNEWTRGFNNWKAKNKKY